MNRCICNHVCGIRRRYAELPLQHLEIRFLNFQGDRLCLQPLLLQCFPDVLRETVQFGLDEARVGGWGEGSLMSETLPPGVWRSCFSTYSEGDAEEEVNRCRCEDCRNHM